MRKATAKDGREMNVGGEEQRLCVADRVKGVERRL